MVKSMYAAVAGLRTHQSRMDVISNNIANVNTWGYKSRSANFEDAMYQNVINSTGGNLANGTGGVNSSQLGYGVNMGSISTNFTTGSRGYTGQPLDCMIDGPAFFIVGGYNGGLPVGLDKVAESGLSLSRVGMFGWDNTGQFVDNAGNYVYGFKPIYDADDKLTGFDETQLVQLNMADPKDPTKLLDIKQTSIQADGTIVGVDQDNKPITLGKLAVATVGNPNGLEQGAGYLYQVGANAGAINVSGPTKTTGETISNYLEMSNVDLAMDISTMITTQRGYQANSKIITVTDQMLEELVNMKR